MPYLETRRLFLGQAPFRLAGLAIEIDRMQDQVKAAVTDLFVPFSESPKLYVPDNTIYFPQDAPWERVFKEYNRGTGCGLAALATLVSRVDFPHNPGEIGLELYPKGAYVPNDGTWIKPAPWENDRHYSGTKWLVENDFTVKPIEVKGNRVDYEAVKKCLAENGIVLASIRYTPWAKDDDHIFLIERILTLKEAREEELIVDWRNTSDPQIPVLILADPFVNKNHFIVQYDGNWQYMFDVRRRNRDLENLMRRMPYFPDR